MILVEQEIITEASRAGQDWFLNGIFAQAEVGNRNQRIYPDKILTREMESWIQEKVSSKTAVGELSHPQSAQINPDRVCMLVESMEKQGNDWIGKAKVLGTPCGNIVKAMLEGGVRIGVSTRGSGDTKKRGDGLSEVQDNYKLHTIDAVLNPSAPKAMVNAVLENEELFESLLLDNILYENFVEFLHAKKMAKNTKNKQLREEKLFQAFSKVLRTMK